MIKLQSLQTSMMQQDPTTIAFSEAIGNIAEETNAQIYRALIYPAVDNLDHATLDDLAWQFKTLGYKTTLTIDQKRALIKNTVKVNRFIGTAFALKSTLASLYSSAKVEEWFENGGEPYTFKVRVKYAGDTENETMLDVCQNVLDVVNETKNVRSVLSAVIFMTESICTVKVASHTTTAQKITILPYMPPPITVQALPSTRAWTKTGQTITILGKD